MVFVQIAFTLFALIASAVIFRHQRLLTYLAAAAALWQGQWLLFGFIHRVFLPAFVLENLALIAAFVMLVVSVALARKFRIPQVFNKESFLRDLVVIPVIAVVLLAASLVAQKNYQQLGGWITHGFLNGDTLTFVSLVQRSTNTIGLVTQNPLAGNGPLEYPTLLHGSVADFLTLEHISWQWFYNLPLLTYLQILIIVPLFFLLQDMALVAPAQKWQMWLGIPSRFVVLLLQAGIVLGIIALSWDNYIYPQSHFFLYGVFLLSVCGLATSFSSSGKSQWLPLAVGSIGVALLYISNAVTGTVALSLLGMLCLIRMNTAKDPVKDRVIYLILLVASIVWFFVWTPGESALGKFNFSYTAAYDMLRLSSVIILVIAAVWINRQRQKFLALSTIGLCALSFIIFFFSQRDIVVENASRFLYHALLIGSPLLLPLLIQLFYWVRRQLVFTSQMLVETIFGGSAIAILVCIVWVLPTGLSVLSAMDNLLYKDIQVESKETIDVMEWIEGNTSPSSVFVTSPSAPWTIPFFTGRSILRATDYWLSPADHTFNQLEAAFEGDALDQAEVVNKGDYLYLTNADKELWKSLPYQVVLNTPSYTIYNLHATK